MGSVGSTALAVIKRNLLPVGSDLITMHIDAPIQLPQVCGQSRALVHSAALMGPRSTASCARNCMAYTPQPLLPLRLSALAAELAAVPPDEQRVRHHAHQKADATDLRTGAEAL
jgi:hypothetical protein